MEDGLEVYAEPYDPTRPTVNFDETTKQLSQETRQPPPPQPEWPQRYDYAYERNGTRHLLLFVEPQAGRRPVQVTAQRTKGACAHPMQWLMDEGDPAATVMRGVLDNLHTHKTRRGMKPSSLPMRARNLNGSIHHFHRDRVLVMHWLRRIRVVP